MKPNGSFKLSKSVKRVLATMPNSVQRSEVKRLFIDAELTKAYAPKNTRVKDKSE